MTIEDKVTSARTVLTTLCRFVSFHADDKKLIDYTSNNLFSLILGREDLSEEQKKSEIDIATAGVLVLALSHHHKRFKKIKNIYNKSSPYLFTEYGVVKSPYYIKTYDYVILKSGISQANDQDNEDINKYNETLVMAVGSHVMNGDLPFDTDVLNAIIDKYPLDEIVQNEKDKQNLVENIYVFKQFVKVIAQNIKLIPSNEIKESFRKATSVTRLDALKDVEPQVFARFKLGIIALRNTTLANFRNKETNFNLDNCLAIADSAFTLATKVCSNTLTQTDIDNFTNKTQKYKTSHTFAIALEIIISAAFGMIIGAVSGFILGSIPGAIIGGVAGLAICGGVSSISCTMWYHKKDPLNVVSSAAKEFITNQPIYVG